MAKTLHHSQIKFFSALGVTPIMSADDDDSLSIHYGDKTLKAASAKALIQAIKAGGQDLFDEIAAAQVAQRARSGMVYAEYKKRYAATDGHCGDDLAAMLREATQVADDDGNVWCDVKRVQAIAKENGFVAKGKNPGHALMNTSNVLRARVRKGIKVTIDGKAVRGEVHAPKCW